MFCVLPVMGALAKPAIEVSGPVIANSSGSAERISLIVRGGVMSGTKRAGPSTTPADPSRQVAIRVEVPVDCRFEPAVRRCGSRTSWPTVWTWHSSARRWCSCRCRPRRREAAAASSSRMVFVHRGTVARRGREAGERARVVAESLTVERVVAHQEAGVEVSVAPGDRVVELEVPRAELGESSARRSLAAGTAPGSRWACLVGRRKRLCAGWHRIQSIHSNSRADGRCTTGSCCVTYASRLDISHV